jgi:CheY-like chemotaxis protein
MTTILLIDDSKLMRIANQRTLAKAGYQVLTAEDGMEAMQVARDRHPDVIILDLMLPKLGGLEVLHRLKDDAQLTDIPVLVLSGLSQRNEVKLRAEGAAAFLEKTAILENEQLLLELIERLVAEQEVCRNRLRV